MDQTYNVTVEQKNTYHRLCFQNMTVVNIETLLNLLHKSEISFSLTLLPMSDSDEPEQE